MDETGKTAKRYWLKLQHNFFSSNEVLILEGEKDGHHYILLWLRLLLMCLGDDEVQCGFLRLNANIPYTADMLSRITKVNQSIVESGIQRFVALGMLEIMDDGTYYIEAVQHMIGRSDLSNERVKKHRERKKLLISKQDVTECNADVTVTETAGAAVTECNGDVTVTKRNVTPLRVRDREEVDKELEIEPDKQPSTSAPQRTKPRKSKQLPEDQKKTERMKLLLDALHSTIPDEYFARCKRVPYPGEKTPTHPDLFIDLYDATKKLDKKELDDTDLSEWILKNRLENGSWTKGLTWGIVILFIDDFILDRKRSAKKEGVRSKWDKWEKKGGCL